MRSSPTLIYRLLDKDYPESFSAYSPHKESFYDLVCSKLPEGWSIERGDMWFYCAPTRHAVPLQGWKIHVSATLGNCRQVLERTVSVLFKYQDVSFKFALDRSILSLINSKTWPRASSGKFITVYPPSSGRFLELIEEIDQATAGLMGPYILSDRRHKKSGVVFYRYGGMQAHSVLDVTGEKIPVLRCPDGSAIPDQRLAFPVDPAWETPVLPVDSGEDVNSQQLSLLYGRYAIETAVSFSSAGGVYFARDQKTGKKVVVKEARPFINAADDHDAVELLKKEHRLLTLLADTGIAPQPLDLFQEWEHWFLVEEFVDGVAMRNHSAASNILLRTRAAEKERDQWCEMFDRLCKELVRILNILHRRGIVFGDLSTNNLIVTPGAQELKIIDFEGAHQLGVDEPVNIYTPGFVSQHRVAGGQARPEDDYYSAGAVLLAYLLPINGLLHLNPRARRQLLAAICNDIPISKDTSELINNWMENPGPSIVEEPSALQAGSSQPVSSQHPAQAVCDYQAVVDGIVAHLNGIAEYQRKDRLYPADPQVFATNPLSLAYGASGVAYALFKVTGKVPQAATDWILQQRMDPASYPPGLYVGISGIAWSLLEMGFAEIAEETFQSACKHALVFKSADLFHGAAGWGMAGLRFFHATGKEPYLEEARRAGNALLQSGKDSQNGCHWGSDECLLGLAHGSSGVALFLLYLYLSTGDQRYLETGVRALNFDLAAAVQTKDGGLSWGKSIDSVSTVYPFWRFGSAGIGMVAARYYAVLGTPQYRAVLEQIFIDTDRKYAVFPGRFSGLAGLGDFLLDMYDMTGEPRFLQSAQRVAEGIMLFRVERDGTAFPGELSSRLCCDYGTGSAGIALFLNRLLGRQKSDFLLDELLERPTSGLEGDKTSINAMACAMV